MTGVVQCPASGVLVDRHVPLHVTELVCPTCGLLVLLGGTPRAPRYTVHNEPPSLGDAIAAYYAADEDDDFGDFDGGRRQAHVTDLRDRLRGGR